MRQQRPCSPKRDSTVSPSIPSTGPTGLSMDHPWIVDCRAILGSETILYNKVVHPPSSPSVLLEGVDFGELELQVVSWRCLCCCCKDWNTTTGLFPF
jgi:hypothetical protein